MFVPVVVLKVRAVWCLYLQWFPWYQRCRLSGVCTWCGFFGAEGAGCLLFVPVVVSLVAKVQLSGVCTCSSVLGGEDAGYLVFVPVVGSLMANVQVVWCLYL